MSWDWLGRPGCATRSGSGGGPGGRPLTLLAAERLRGVVKAGDSVILATGAGGPPWMPAGETDGPVGVAARFSGRHRAGDGRGARGRGFDQHLSGVRPRS